MEGSVCADSHICAAEVIVYRTDNPNYVQMTIFSHLLSSYLTCEGEGYLLTRGLINKIRHVVYKGGFALGNDGIYLSHLMIY